MSEPLPFDLRALEIFLAVCEHGTMVAAARALGLTQPAVSQAVAELEARTGVVLLDRKVRPLGQTQAGLMLRHRAAFLLSEARQIAPLLRHGVDRRLRLIRIGLVDSLTRATLSTLAAALRERAAQAVFLSGLTAVHGSALLTRQVDLFLGVDDLADSAGRERWPSPRRRATSSRSQVSTRARNVRIWLKPLCSRRAAGTCSIAVEPERR